MRCKLETVTGFQHDTHLPEKCLTYGSQVLCGIDEGDLGTKIYFEEKPEVGAVSNIAAASKSPHLDNRKITRTMESSPQSHDVRAGFGIPSDNDG